jgi:Matrixin
MRLAERWALVLVVAFASVAPARARAWCQLTSCRRSPTAAEPCVMADGEKCFPLAWRQRCTEISLSHLESSTMSLEDVRGVFRSAFDQWEAVTCNGVPVGVHAEVLEEQNDCTEASHQLDYSNVNSIMFVSEGWETERMHDPLAFAITLVWNDRRTGDILDADMEINEARGPYGICPDAPEDSCPTRGNGTALTVDLPNVITHELGHYLGLAHTPDARLATMWAAADDTETHKRTLETDDQEGLCAVYPAGSLPETCDPTPRGGLNLACTAKPACGCRAAGLPSSSSWSLAALTALGLMGLRRRR